MQSFQLQSVSISLLGRAVSGSLLISLRDRRCCSLRSFALQISPFELVVLVLIPFEFLPVFSRTISSCLGHSLKKFIDCTLRAEWNERMNAISEDPKRCRVIGEILHRLICNRKTVNSLQTILMCRGQNPHCSNGDRTVKSLVHCGSTTSINYRIDRQFGRNDKNAVILLVDSS